MDNLLSVAFILPIVIMWWAARPIIKGIKSPFFRNVSALLTLLFIFDMAVWFFQDVAKIVLPFRKISELLVWTIIFFDVNPMNRQDKNNKIRNNVHPEDTTENISPPETKEPTQ